MIKVNNKKIISAIAKTTYKANKKRNMLTVFAIMLTTLLLTSVIGIGIVYWNTISQRSVRMIGMDYDIELTEPTQAQVEKVRGMKAVKAAGVAVKCGIVEAAQEKPVGKIQLYWADTVCWKMQCLPAFEFIRGRYPEKENEILLSTTALKAMGIQKPYPGMEISLFYYPLTAEGDTKTVTGIFSLSGYYRDYSGRKKGFVSRSFYDHTGAKQTDLTQGTLKISLKNPLYSKEDIVSMQNQVGLEGLQCIEADYDTISNFLKAVIGLGGLLLMIFVSGYLFIYNTLYISVSKDIRYYGQLKTIGMTSVQLKRMIHMQAAWNACLGVPLGLGLGAAVSQGIIPGVLKAINPTLHSQNIVPLHPSIYVGAALFSVLTIFVSCRKPAMMAGECTPIEAAGYIPPSSRKVRLGRDRGLSSMAWRNMFRDKKQAFVILGSFVIAILVYMGVHAVIRGNDTREILNHSFGYDLQIRNDTTLEAELPLLTEDKLEKIRKTPGVKCVREVTSATAVVPLQEDVFGEYYRELYQSRYTPGNYQKDMEAYRQDPYGMRGRFTTRLTGIDTEGFQKLNQALGGTLNEEEFARGNIGVAENFFEVSAQGAVGKTVRFSLSGGAGPEGEHSIQIGDTADAKDIPAFFSAGYTPGLIVSAAFLEKISGRKYVELVDVDYVRPLEEETEERLLSIYQDTDLVSFTSKLENYKEMSKTESQIKVLGNGIGIILGLLSILNYVNMMASGVHARKKEFATLESLGMTTRQIRKVLLQEGLGYAFISIGASVLLGIPLSGLVFRSVNRYGISFSLPLLENLMVFAAVFFVCMAVPPVIYHLVSNRGAIED